MVKQIIKEAMEKNPIGMKEAVEAELMERLALALEAKKNSYDLEESFKRGDIIEVQGAGSSTHKAVMLSNSKAVYLEDDGSVESVPSYALQRASKAKRVSKDEKDLAKEYLSNMKEEFDLEESVKDLGHGIRVNVDSDKSMVIGDRSAPGGSQMVVLEKSQVSKMVSVLTAGKPVKTDLGGGAKLSLDKDGDVVISANAPGGRQMVVLTAKQVQELLKLVK